jgi:hypothetical protein
MRRALLTIGWSATVAGMLLALHGPLAPDAPTGWTISALHQYVAGHGPDTAVMAVVWLAAMAGAWYLAVVTALGIVARLLRAAATVDVLDRLTVPVVRRMLGTWLAVSAVATPAASAWAASGPARAAAPVVMVLETSTTAPVTMVLETAPPAPATPAPPIPVAPEAGEHVVQAGEHFWSIAESELARGGHTPTTREVARYWQTLVTANQSRLRVPSNPDLLYPGQRLVLPQPQ